jgi:hypothetical protein
VLIAFCVSDVSSWSAACSFCCINVSLQLFESVSNHWISNGLTDRSESSMTLLLWPSTSSKVVISHTFGLLLGHFVTVGKEKCWTKRDEDVGRMENGEDLGGGTVVRDLIGWKQFSCFGRCICMRPLPGSRMYFTRLAGILPTRRLFLRLAGVLKDRSRFYGNVCFN